MNRKHIVNCIAVALLLMMFALALGSARLKSPTMDEQNHIARGAAYLLTGDLRLSVEHPPLVNTLSALPLLLCPQLELPLEHPSWQNGAWYVFADQFLWQANAHQVECIVFLSRLLVMALGLLLGALLYRWAREMGGERAGLLALFLLVCDPNILAHTRLVTTDLGVTFFVFLALYTLWRVWGRQAPHLGEQVLRHWGNVILAGIALGLALTAKFSALLLIPLFALMAFYQAITHKTPRPLITLLAIFALAALSLWAVYGFEIGPLSPGGLPLPAPSYLNGVRAILQRTEGGNPAFLLGRYSTTGWWYYFPLAFLVKTPLPTLLLLAASLISTLRRRAWNRDLFLLIPMAAFFGVNLFSHLNIGYRHLLPALPFAFVYVSQRISSKFLLADAKPRILNSKPGTLNPKPGTLNLKQVVGGLLAAWYLISAVLIYPDYLTYFNELAGGSSNGYRWLVDSNLDWGQDLPGLQRYVEEHGLKEIYL
ncbi:MAG: phospholipid carrier-dependent glycosyltransferase, partial [Anaerolineae bacterium]|nr:phospholipid carrier-dependent glycosyltransferase [Anaerolineae bacterium]